VLQTHELPIRLTEDSQKLQSTMLHSMADISSYAVLAWRTVPALGEYTRRSGRDAPGLKNNSGLPQDCWWLFRLAGVRQPLPRPFVNWMSRQRREAEGIIPWSACFGGISRWSAARWPQL
jgi:hypothetical protein